MVLEYYLPLLTLAFIFLFCETMGTATKYGNFTSTNLVTVSRCEELREALEQTNSSAIGILDCLTCSPETWGSLIILDKRNVTIQGLTKCTLRWTTPGAAIRVQGEASVHFHNLTISTMAMTRYSFQPLFLEVLDQGKVEFQSTRLELNWKQVKKKEKERHHKRIRCQGLLQDFQRLKTHNDCSGKGNIIFCNSTVFCSSNSDFQDKRLRSEALKKSGTSSGEIKSSTVLEPSGDRSVVGGRNTVPLIIPGLLVATFAIIMCCLSCLIAKKHSTKHRKARYSETEEECHGLSAASTTVFHEHDVTMTDSFLRSIQVEKAIIQWQIGKGKHGSVYKASYEGKTVAVKVICSTETNGFIGASTEAYFAQNALHPNVVRSFCTLSSVANDWSDLVDMSRDASLSSSISGSLDDFLESSATTRAEQESWLIMMEYCDIGNLRAVLRESELLDRVITTGVSQGTFLCKIAVDIATGMLYLHNKGIVHGDLKPQNILLQSNASVPLGFVAKIGDFGLSRDMTHTTLVRTKTCGSVRYMSPELLREGLLSMKTDIYSFGIVLWEMVVGADPFFGKSDVEVMLMVSEGKRPQPLTSIPGKLGVIIRLCLQEDYMARPGFKQLVSALESK